MLSSDFIEIMYTYVFLFTDYEYHAEFICKFDFHGETHENYGFSILF